MTGSLTEAVRRPTLVRITVIVVLVMRCPSVSAEDQAHIDLSGEWAFALDHQDVGAQEKWFDKSLNDHLQLPGTLQSQGFGDAPGVNSPWIGNIRPGEWEKPKYAPYREPDNFKMPFWLQPDRVYVGPAWYQRTVTISESWTGKRVVLELERCHWFTQVWVDGNETGRRDSLSTPHVYDLTDAMTPGEHRLTVRVDNRVLIGVGINSHSVSDHTQGDWNGIVGRIELKCTPKVFIDDVQVFPDVESKTAKVVVAVGSVPEESKVDRALSAKLRLKACCGDHVPPAVTQQCSIPSGGGKVEMLLPLGEAAKLWYEFQPNVYTLTTTLETVAGVDEQTVTFGLREIAVKDKQFVLNGRPIMFRGTLECCIFPLTGHPPTDVESWKRVIRVCKQHGLNHMRFHSHCPPEAAFVAADELGFYFHVECASWANQGSGLGLGHPIDEWIYAEAERIRRAYGNHPSFMLMAYGNEPAGPGRGGQYLGPWVEHQKAADPRRLYTGAAGWPIIPQNEYHNIPEPRIQAWGGGLKSRINARPPETMTDYRDVVQRLDVPVISHEIGQWCVYPNFGEIPKYTGALKAKNFEVFRDFLNAKHMGDQAHDFLMASGKLQTLCYKEEIESALRTPGFGGFHLLDLHDFPGQGTALVGVLDPFWDSKPYVSPAEFRRFCNTTVPLARMSQRVWTNAETFAADIEVSHFGPKPLRSITPRWSLTDGTGEVAAGNLPTVDIPIGHAIPVGRVELALSRFDQPAKLTLTVILDGSDFGNDWDVWVYPNKTGTNDESDVMIVDSLDDAAAALLNQGGKVLLLADPRTVNNDIAIGFSPIFWNTAWTGGQAPHTLGILCSPKHPALAEFPTEYHSNWQWWELISRSGAMVLDDLPTGLRPIVQVVPDWFEPRRLGLVFEARVDSGRLLVCSIDLTNDLAQRPVARQMRRSLLRYMATEAFAPKHKLKVDQVRGLFRELSTIEKLGAKAWSDSQQRGYEAARAIDGNPETIWHTVWQPKSTKPPHWLVIDLQKPVVLAGMTYLPRADLSNGRIGKYEIYVSNHAKKWDKPITKGEWANDAKLKTIRFEKPVTGRYLKLVALSEVNGHEWSSAAEIDVLITTATDLR